MATTAKPQTRRERYNPQQFEQKWRDAWAAAELYKFRPDDPRPKWYAITMYPYPSGDLHIGHWYAMAPPDAVARYHRMLGYNVFFPMGFDAFGLPAENAAIQRNIHPYKWTMANIENMRRQLRSMGAMFDWDQEVITCDPEFYIWNQRLFLLFYEQGLAYRAKAPVWWCPKDQTVLANEQVIDGRCERCGSEVYRRELEQWFFRITAYADELLSFDGIDWPEPIKLMQRNWIGRSEGANVTFTTETGDQLEIFTTRPDTLWGTTFMVLAPEHPLVAQVTTDSQRTEVDQYVEQTSRQSEIERQSTAREKSGVFTGGYAINPVNGERVPIWIADYVLLSYGTGAIMGVPAHDERDFAFALAFGLPIIPVIARLDGLTHAVVPAGAVIEPIGFETALKDAGVSFHQTGDAYQIAAGADKIADFLHIMTTNALPGAVISYAGARMGMVADGRVIELADLESDAAIAGALGARTAMEALAREPYYVDAIFHSDYGAMINSGELSGTPGDEAVTATIAWLEARGIGRGEVIYRLRDWLLSRQRYWGTPIPIIYCDNCGVVPVPDEDLPVLLPSDSEFEPTGESPLKSDERFMNVSCPTCGGPALRETDTMDTFVDSAWYQYRYLSPHDDEHPFDADLSEHWMPVDQYTGGREHAVMHLLYTRFFTKAFRDLGMTRFSEPFTRLRNQGIVLGEDHEKMSKSRGNVVDLDDLVERLGTDTVRLFLMFMRPWSQGGPWDSQGIAGVQRFLDRSYTVVTETIGNPAEPVDDEHTRRLRRATHKTIKAVTEDFETFSLNTAVARLMELVNELMKLKDTATSHTQAWHEATRTLVLLLAPAAPHIAEELWARLGNPFSVHQQDWPVWDAELAADEQVEIAVSVNGKVRGRLLVAPEAAEADVLAAAKADERVAAYLTGPLVKEIYVPGRLVNFVVR